MRPIRLLTATADRPMGIDPRTAPRLEWTIPATTGSRQSAYRIQLVASSGAFSDPEWDSGRVESDASVGIECGVGLESGARYRWRVKVWTENGGESEWSEPTWFECGPAPDDWDATAIAAPRSGADVDPVPAVRTSFESPGDVDRARLYVATGGTHVVRLNGDRIGDRQLDPAFTDYEERTLYAIHDVTDDLRAGANTLGFLLGRGRYAMATESVWGWREAPWHADRPSIAARLEIEYADGRSQRITTGEDWEAAESATRFDSLFAGERYDAREALGEWTRPDGDDAVEWSTVEPVAGPEGEYVPQIMQPMGAIDEVRPDAITEPDDGVYVFDMGEMIAGWTRLAVEAPSGTELTLTHAEKLDEDGFADISQWHVEADLQTDRYVCGGDGTEIWEPQFTYRGFRYVQVEGLPGAPDPDLLAGVYVHSRLDAGWDSEFACGDDLLNRIHGNVRRGLLNNVHGIPTDSPMFEKNGWTGDVHVTADAVVYNFDAARFYRKWLDDVADAQREDGELPPIVPTSDWGYEGSHVGGMSGPLPGWDGVYVFLPWTLYRHHGDRRTLERHFDGMRRLVDFYADLGDDHVVDAGLGDWLPPGSGQTAETMKPPEGPAITSTGYYYRMAGVVSEAAGVLGREDDAEAYAALAGDIAVAFDDRFWDGDRGYYRTGEVDEYRQTSNVFPLTFGMVPEERVDRVVSRLIEDVLDTRDGHLDTGFHGTKYLLTTLAEHGHVDVAYEIASQDTYPSWGHWIVENDATALYEAWEPESRSRDHPAFGSIDEFCYGTLAGISPAEPGYRRVEIRPRIPRGLDRAAATVDTVRGPVRSAWERTGDAVSLDVTVPGNAVGEVYVPTAASEPRIGGGESSAASPARLGEFDGGTIWEVPPGNWSFDAD